MRRRLPAIFAAVVLTCTGATAQQNPARISVITVQGDGRADVPPDHVQFTAEVVTKGKTLEAATAAHRERAGKAAPLLRAMESEGLTIERSLFRLEENRPAVPAGQKQPDPEFRAVTSFSLKSNRIDTVDRIVTSIAESGLFEIQNLRFGLEDNNPGIAKARRDAVEDARTRAMTYAEATGSQLGEIMEIVDGSPRPLREMAAPMAMRTTVQVTPPETLALTASITIKWRLLPAP